MRDPRAAPPAAPAGKRTDPASGPESVSSAHGRRILSAAFVRAGPDGHLTVELRDGRVLVLRDVTMRREDYCGVEVVGGAAGGRRCGGYAQVAAARPGGGPTAGRPDPATPEQAAPGGPQPATPKRPAPGR